MNDAAVPITRTRDPWGTLAIDLNCDLGESFGAWTMGADADVMPFITSANIACGFHAGDPDNIVGSVHIKDLLRHLVSNQPVTVAIVGTKTAPDAPPTMVP